MCSSDFSGTVNLWILNDEFTKFEQAEREREENAVKTSAENQDPKIEGHSRKPEELEKDVEDRMLKSAIVMERMLSLNTYHDVAQDFRYYEDPSDELKITEETAEGSLLPLWSFTSDITSHLEVTGLCWSQRYPDLFGN